MVACSFNHRLDCTEYTWVSGGGYLQLGEDLADVPEAALSDVHVLFVALLNEQRLWGIVKELGEREQLLDLLHSPLLVQTQTMQSILPS